MRVPSAKSPSWRRGIALLAVVCILSIAASACGGSAGTVPQPTTASQTLTAALPSTIAPEPTTEGRRLRFLRFDSLTPPPVAKEINGCKIEPDTQCPGADLSSADLGAIIAGSNHVARTPA